MMNFEESVKSLKEKRSNLQEAESFEKITSIWKEIKEIHGSCSKKLGEVKEKMEKLEENSESTEELDLTFPQAIKEMEEISASIENTSISNFPEKIKRMQDLKSFCLKRLEEQKINMEEVK